jgi:hypothetical protein
MRWRMHWMKFRGILGHEVAIEESPKTLETFYLLFDFSLG